MSKSRREKQSLGRRFRILAKSKFRCHYCGTPASETKLHIDHVIPLAKGGADHPSNMVAACSDCNLGKGALILEEITA